MTPQVKFSVGMNLISLMLGVKVRANRLCSMVRLRNPDVQFGGPGHNIDKSSCIQSMLDSTPTPDNNLLTYQIIHACRLLFYV